MVILAEDKTPPLIIRVDYSVKPVYPNWTSERFLLLGDLEERDAQKGIQELAVREWFLPEQLASPVPGFKVAHNLLMEEMLIMSAGLRELVAISQIGTQQFLERFGKKAVFGWKTMMSNWRKTRTGVPYLFEYLGEVRLLWRAIDDLVGPNNPALIVHDPAK
jgi:hypothetical protein